MNQPGWKGIFPSLPTPFTAAGDLDLDGQRAVVDFAVRGGADGLICFGLAGEVFRLTPRERIELLEVIVDEAAGRVPVLAGVGTEAEHTSIALAREAAQVGADGIVIPPPVTASPSSDELVGFFAAVSGATPLPAMVQDAPEYLQIEVGPDIVARVAERTPQLAAVKLEAGAAGTADWVQALGDRLLIFCGSGGLYLLDCLEMGAAGVAPGTDLTDQLAQVYAAWAAGDLEAAWAQQSRLLPMLVFQMQDIEHYNATAKYVLGRRGIPIQPHLRAPCLRLGDQGRAIVDRYLKSLDLAEAGREA